MKVQDVHPTLKVLMEKCWKHDPAERPEFNAIHKMLSHLKKKKHTLGLDAPPPLPPHATKKDYVKTPSALYEQTPAK